MVARSGGSVLRVFPINQFPQRVGRLKKLITFKSLEETVSNQLVSLASREGLSSQDKTFCELKKAQFPINQFPQRVGRRIRQREQFIPLSFPINQFPQRVGREIKLSDTKVRLSFTSSFQSISFPSEQGALKGGLAYLIAFCVSNQLVSLASREQAQLAIPARQGIKDCFQSISFPSEQGVNNLMVKVWDLTRFQSISFPSEQGVVDI